MYKKMISAAAAIACGLCTSAMAAGDLAITQTGIIMDGTEHELADRPFRQAGTTYVSLDEAMPACGYTLGWDPGINATICEKDDRPDSIVFPGGDVHIVGYSMYHYTHPVVVIDGKCYIDSSLFADLTDSNVRVEDGVGGRRLPDSYRIDAYDEAEYSGITVLNRSYIFKPTAISNESAIEYASIVNKFAQTLPEVNVYNMLIPDSSEFYAPRSYYRDQLSSFELVYDLLENVTPIPVGDALWEHAGEKLYFEKDHHWTQRGAYYAWKRFMELKGETVPELDTFEAHVTYDFKGSYIKEFERMGVENAVDEKTEMFERFIPANNTKVDIYDDMSMNKFAATMPLVNLYSSDYGAFIYGDTPLTVITGGVKNGKSIVIFKESMGNVLSTWAVNNYEKVYVVDIREYRDGSFDLRTFYENLRFDDLLVESYPATVESADLRADLASLD